MPFRLVNTLVNVGPLSKEIVYVCYNNPYFVSEGIIRKIKMYNKRAITEYGSFTDPYSVIRDSSACTAAITFSHV